MILRPYVRLSTKEKGHATRKQPKSILDIGSKHCVLFSPWSREIPISKKSDTD